MPFAVHVLIILCFLRAAMVAFNQDLPPLDTASVPALPSGSHNREKEKTNGWCCVQLLRNVIFILYTLFM